MTPELEIEINQGQFTVELPAYLAHADLTAAELATIFVIATIPCDQDPQLTFERLAGEEYKEATLSLKERGIVVVTTTDGTIGIHINLNPLAP